MNYAVVTMQPSMRREPPMKIFCNILLTRVPESLIAEVAEIAAPAEMYRRRRLRRPRRGTKILINRAF